MPILKRIFGQGKNKASNTLVALCIGDYSRITLPIIGQEAHQLEALLAHVVAADDGSPSSSQPAQPSTKGSGLGQHQTSFKAFRHLLQHFGGGGGASSSSQEGGEAEAQQHLAQFLKHLAGYSTVSFVTAAEDGLVSRDKVLSKLTKLFKQSTASVVIVSYCGPSDERGNWRLASQIPAASGASGGGGVGGSSVVSFREVSMLWQRHRKHSQRLVLLLDCANSGYWVSALRLLSKAEQLELSLGVQASDCSVAATQNMQLTYQPGIFLQFYLSNNKWRRDNHRRSTQQATQKGSQQQQQQHQGSVGGGSVHAPGRGEQWLPGMLPSYYATWLIDNLVDYGIVLRFFNSQVAPHVSSGGEPHGAGGDADTVGNAAAAMRRPCSLKGGAGGWQSNIALLAKVESNDALNRASRLGDDITSPSSDPWASGQSTGLGPLELEALKYSADRVAIRTALAMRAVSVADSARRRFSSLADYYNTTNDSSGPPSQQVVGSPTTPDVQRVRMSTPQADWITSPSVTFTAHRSPTLPGEDSLYKMCNDTDGSASTQAQATYVNDVVSPSASTHASMLVGGTIGGAGPSCAADDGAGGSLTLSATVPPAAAARPPAHAAAVHPFDIDIDIDDDSTDGGRRAGGGDEQMVVQHSARSDTVAIAWDRRSTHAERCLLEGERGGGVTSSFTGPSSRRGGFANELYGALHEVATERRLWARRAPLEGDETMDTLMQDADLERRASNASLPSIILPRDMACATAGAESTSITQAVVPGSVYALRSGQGGAGVGRGPCSTNAVMAMVSPRGSIMLGQAATNQAADGHSNATPRQMSRLSMGPPSCTLETDFSIAQLNELAEQNDDSVIGLSITVTAVPSAETLQKPGALKGCGREAELKSTSSDGRPAEGTAGGGNGGQNSSGGADCLPDMAMALLMQQDMLEANSVRTTALMEFLQPAHSPSPSPAHSAAPSTQERRRVRASGAGAPPSRMQSIPSGSILRSLLKQHVSITDSMDLDSASLVSQPMWQRRPGRFEMAGSESSSFVFGDDQERFEMLRLLREHQGGDGKAAGMGGDGGAGNDEVGMQQDDAHAGGATEDGTVGEDRAGSSAAYGGDLLLSMETDGSFLGPGTRQVPYQAEQGRGPGASLFTAVAAAAAKMVGREGRGARGAEAREHVADDLSVGDDDCAEVLAEDVSLDVQ